MALIDCRYFNEFIPTALSKNLSPIMEMLFASRVKETLGEVDFCDYTLQIAGTVRDQPTLYSKVSAD